MSAAMPRAMALRVVSLPAAIRRLKNMSSSRSESGSERASSPSTAARATVAMMSSPPSTRLRSMRSVP